MDYVACLVSRSPWLQCLLHCHITRAHAYSVPLHPLEQRKDSKIDCSYLGVENDANSFNTFVIPDERYRKQPLESLRQDILLVAHVLLSSLCSYIMKDLQFLCSGQRPISFLYIIITVILIPDAKLQEMYNNLKMQRYREHTIRDSKDPRSCSLIFLKPSYLPFEHLFGFFLVVLSYFSEVPKIGKQKIWDWFSFCCLVYRWLTWTANFSDQRIGRHLMSIKLHGQCKVFIYGSFSSLQYIGKCCSLSKSVECCCVLKLCRDLLHQMVSIKTIC